MSFLKKLKQMLVGDAKPADSIKIVEVSSKQQEERKVDRKPKDSPKNKEVRKPAPAKEKDGKPKDSFEPKRKKNDEKEKSGDYRFGQRRKPSDTEEQSRQQPSGDRPSSGRKYKEDGSPRRTRNDRRKRTPKFSEEVSSVNPDFVETTFSPWSISEFVVEPEEGKMRFHDLNLPDSIMRGVADAGYQYCTPIQAMILPEACKSSDVSGKAQTGTGKTASFLITIFKRLLEKNIENRKKGTPRALIMAPTRELVIQIEKDARMIGKYTGFTIQSVFGGINYEKQRRQVEGRFIDILVATPGRLLDYQEQGVLDLSAVEILVIDEADRMLDMGFIPDMRRIVNSTPPKGVRQTMLFSATLTPEIIRLASSWTKDAISFEVEANEITAEAIEQRAYIVTERDKFPLIYNMITNENLSRVIIFGNRRTEVSRLADLFKLVDISCGLLSGDVSQARRIRTLEDLRAGKIRVLCATDVAARGLHVDDVSHVFNFTLPDDPEDYVHRIGRTGRAGASGISILFATEEDAYVIPKIEQFTGHKLIYINPEEELVTLPEDIAKIIPAKQLHIGSGRPRGVPGRSGRPMGRRPAPSASKAPFRGQRRGR